MNSDKSEDTPSNVPEDEGSMCIQELSLRTGGQLWEIPTSPTPSEALLLETPNSNSNEAAETRACQDTASGNMIVSAYHFCIQDSY